MINPLCRETEWMNLWAQLPMWQAPPYRVLVMVPHPDDETLAIGGFLASRRSLGIDATLLSVSDGENAYVENHALGSMRQREQTLASAHLGISEDKIVRLHFPDSRIEDYEEELGTRLADLISPNTLLLAPWVGDFHPDHTACGRVALKVAIETGTVLVSYLFWTWHTQEVADVGSLPLQKFDLQPEWFAAKTAALAEHQSQLKRDNDQPILTPEFLWPARQTARCFFRMSDVTSAEFFDRKYRSNTDPWDFAKSEYERARYNAIVAELDGRIYERGFEPGCSIGVLTALLAGYCRSIEALDISPTAVGLCQQRCRRLPHVNAWCGSLSEWFPSGHFDLIVFSEIGYYFTGKKLRQLARTLVSRLLRGGTFLAVHWLGISEDHLLTGERVHEILRSIGGLTHCNRKHYGKFLMDRRERQ